MATARDPAAIPLPELTGVSIVVPHYGPPDTTERLLAQLDAQDAPVPVEVIVVDDASPEPFPPRAGTTVIRRVANGGFGSAVNTGAAAAEHPALLLLNSDLEIRDDFVAQLLVAAGAHWPAVVGPRVLRPSGEPEWSGRRFPTAAQQAVEWLVPLARFRHLRALHHAVGHDVASTRTTKQVDWVTGAALLLPTASFRAAGGFDERFFMNAEEVDLQRRLRREGVAAVVVDNPAVVHLGGGSSDPELRRRWLVRSRLRYADKWGGRRRLQALLVAATVVNLAWNAGRRLRGVDVAPWPTARQELSLIFDRRR